MKQLNGTVTLAFIEEDNQQRVIFRVIPLCTREGMIFHDQTAEFPDQGSLRVVPDKREQSTFKERMREMGSLCAIYLHSNGKELTKVRQNRNYDPGQGENNQFAIYSDVICEFADDGVFEVFNEGADSAGALSPRVLLRRGQVLYGPLDRGAEADWALLRPFGNDCYLLHTVRAPDGTERSFYWNPEQTVNWRQRRGTLRRGKPRGEDGEPTTALPQDRSAAPLPERSAAAQAQEAVSGGAKPSPAVLTATPKPEKNPAPEAAAPAPRIPAAETALPIGTKLEILDEGISFEEQISKLDQPLSTGANFLAQATPPPPAAEEDSGPLHFNGTPLVRFGVKTPLPIHRGDAFHNVVEHQIRAARQEPGEYSTDFQHIDNPIENLNAALARVWDEPDTQRQALETLCANDAFTQSFLRQLRLGGREMKAVQAAQEQLEDIEAERLSLLMQLEAMKNDDKQARETLSASLTQKKREELAGLEAQARALRAEADGLRAALETLGETARERTLATLAEKGSQLMGSDGQTVALSPVIGQKRSMEEMADAVRTAMNRRGFAVNGDEVIELLLYFALNDEFYLGAETVSTAELCARALLEGLGLADVTAFTRGDTRLAVASLLPDDGLRTPTVEVCPPGRAALTAYGHKTIRLVEYPVVFQANLPLPVAMVPPLKPNAVEAAASGPSRPVALESLRALRMEAAPLMPRGEEWFAELGELLAGQEIRLPEAAGRRMRAFIATASVKLRGGFLAAADAAALGWITPMLLGAELNLEALRPALESLPRTLAALDIR